MEPKLTGAVVTMGVFSEAAAAAKEGDSVATFGKGGGIMSKGEILLAVVAKLVSTPVILSLAVDVAEGIRPSNVGRCASKRNSKSCLVPFNDSICFCNSSRFFSNICTSSVSSLVWSTLRLRHLAAANLLRSRRMRLFSSSSGDMLLLVAGRRPPPRRVGVADVVVALDEVLLLLLPEFEILAAAVATAKAAKLTVVKSFVVEELELLRLLTPKPLRPF
ncbi:hypothetical protein FF38_12597 [Lucilia cuprina]|uniref:Uncharacterized protein n=1 Tax=Lucilia cuprina TaxID=7375 RepID=A0A0L0BMW1_LUCCU|nr:hypothetical protein FF38_12597 [Lucilia cuprina]